LRRELRRANPDADWVTCLRAIACTSGGAEVLTMMRRAAALAAYPEAKRRSVHALLARHRGDRTLLFTAAAEHAYAIAEAELIPVITAEVTLRERDAILAAFRERRVRGVCSARVLNEGGDVPEANDAIIVGGALGAREHVQREGRILRPGVNKYGFALASSFPSVVATPGFRMEARCVLGGEPVVVCIDATDRIARTHALPKDADSVRSPAMSGASARHGRCCASRMRWWWGAARSSPTSPCATRGGSVLVEVVGFYTPKYLRSKLDALRAAAAHPLIACIDESLACADGELAFAVFRFKRRIDAAALIAIAERLREEHRSGALKAAWTGRGDNPTTSH
jgi:hypothetical protein